MLRRCRAQLTGYSTLNGSLVSVTQCQCFALPAALTRWYHTPPTITTASPVAITGIVADIVPRHRPFCDLPLLQKCLTRTRPLNTPPRHTCGVRLVQYPLFILSSIDDHASQTPNRHSRLSASTIASSLPSLTTSSSILSLPRCIPVTRTPFSKSKRNPSDRRFITAHTEHQSPLKNLLLIWIATLIFSTLPSPPQTLCSSTKKSTSNTG